MSLGDRINRQIYPRSLKRGERILFEKKIRKHPCYFESARRLLDLDKLDQARIQDWLAYDCQTIENQIIKIRDKTSLTQDDYRKRFEFTQMILDCLYKHHEIPYEGILFGSSVNGLGFKDSDVDLRLRPLKFISEDCFEPIVYDSDMVDQTLRNIAFQTTRCCPALGEFVPSSRCPIAKLTFLTGNPYNKASLKEGFSYDISLSSSNSLGSFNSIYLRLLCIIEPKFHLMACTLRYWSKVHKLIVSGYLSSYALINMLIFFCQMTTPPLLPTVDYMRQSYLDKQIDRREGQHLPSVSQVEWHCLVDFDRKSYPRSTNDEPLCLLLLRFFEFYLTFNYSNNIITARPGRALSHEEYKQSSQFHPKFPIKDYLNIQDPFDMKHNLTSGMTGEHFRKMMITMRYSYERLFQEILCNFSRPECLNLKVKQNDSDNKQKNSGSAQISKKHAKNWGLNALFVPITEDEHKSGW